MRFLNLLCVCLLALIIGCTSGRKLDPQSVESLRKGMSINEVERLIGPPEHISTAEGGKTYYMYYHSIVGGAFGYAKGKMHKLNLTFTNSRLTHIDKTISHQSGFLTVKTDKIESGRYSDSPREQRVQPRNSTSSEPRGASGPARSYEDRKKQIFDMYLNKEITRDEYFEMRRELDRTR
jgi:outer membrane protein assembly factor BamE (lipoprotein component of BamABCDE complex)